MNTSYPRIIALSGWRQSGKDTTAHYLVNEYGYIQMSFAASLKDMVATTYGVDREILDSPTHKEMPLINYPVIPTDPFTSHIHQLLASELRSGYWTPRALCILEGSIKRSVNANYWVQSVIRKAIDNPQNHYVISDVRYRSEMDALNIMLPDQVAPVRIERFDSIDTLDPSERDLDFYPFAHRLPNRGVVELLYGHIDALLERKE